MIRTKRTDLSKQISGINITPFTDVCLVLLIIFMVTASAMNQKDMGFKLTLPQASESKVLPMPPLVARIEQGPLVFLNNKPVTFATLGHAIAQYPKNTDGSLTMIVKADENVPYRFVIQTIDIAGKAGVSDTLLATRQASPAQPTGIAPVDALPSE